MRTDKYILLAATLFGLSSCGNKKGDYDASGTFEATEVIVSSEANGKIMQFNIEEGQLLKADEEVGCIDTLQLYLKKMQLLASGKAIASKSTDINKQIAATKEQIGKAEYERKRTENLLKENAATQKQIDDIDSQIAVLKKQLEAQISTLQRGNASITEESSAYEIQVAQLDDQLRKCHITSPICGTVLAKYAEAGELVAEKTMDESVDIIDEQNKSINDAKELFGHISDAVNALKEGLDNIASLNEQMDASRENVVKSMEDVASVSTETAAASEEVSASAEEVNATMHTLNQFTVELDEIATHLTEAINRFEL